MVSDDHQDPLHPVRPHDPVLDAGPVARPPRFQEVLHVRPDPGDVLLRHLGDGPFERDRKRLGPVPVDAEHLVRPEHGVVRDEPLPAPDVGDPLGLGQLPFPLAEPSLHRLPLAHLPGQLVVGRGKLRRAIGDPGFQLDRGAFQGLPGPEPLRHHRREEQRGQGGGRVERLQG